MVDLIIDYHVKPYFKLLRRIEDGVTKNIIFKVQQIEFQWSNFFLVE